MLKIFTGVLLLMATLLSGPAAMADEQPSRRPLFLFLFLHDDIKETNLERLSSDYIQWFVRDLESFTGRRVHLQFIRHIPDVTDFAYKGNDLNAIYQPWSSKIDRYIDAQNLPRNGTTKYVLLTQDRINSNTLGFTQAKGYTAIVSLESYASLAHEVGHMLGGTHEAAQVLYRGGWWCETNLVDTRQGYRASCYVYSDENKQRIAAHLSEYP